MKVVLAFASGKADWEIPVSAFRMSRHGLKRERRFQSDEEKLFAAYGSSSSGVAFGNSRAATGNEFAGLLAESDFGNVLRCGRASGFAAFKSMAGTMGEKRL